MKKILAAGVLALGAMTANAQSTVVNNPDNHAYFGIRASFDLSCPGDEKGDVIYGSGYVERKPGAGVSLGMVYNLPLVANLYFEPGLNLYYNTYKRDFSYSDLDGHDYSYEGSCRKFGFRIPVLFGYHFDFSPKFSLAVFTGPELDVGLWGRNYADGSSRKAYDSHGELNRVECLWTAGVGFNITRHYYIGLSGSFGLTNQLRDSPGISFHDNVAKFTLGYNF